MSGDQSINRLEIQQFRLLGQALPYSKSSAARAMGSCTMYEPAPARSVSDLTQPAREKPPPSPVE
jgi:hypothetical protein